MSEKGVERFKIYLNKTYILKSVKEDNLLIINKLEKFLLFVNAYENLKNQEINEDYKKLIEKIYRKTCKINKINLFLFIELEYIYLNLLKNEEFYKSEKINIKNIYKELFYYYDNEKEECKLSCKDSEKVFFESLGNILDDKINIDNLIKSTSFEAEKKPWILFINKKKVLSDYYELLIDNLINLSNVKNNVKDRKIKRLISTKKYKLFIDKKISKKLISQ